MVGWLAQKSAYQRIMVLWQVGFFAPSQDYIDFMEAKNVFRKKN
jgi:hypothetical protein